MKIEAEIWYTADDLARRKIAAKQTLARWRHEGSGPCFHKAGSRVIYKGADVLAWLEGRRVETGAGS